MDSILSGLFRHPVGSREPQPYQPWGDCWLLQLLDRAVCLWSYLAFLKLVVILASRSRPFLLTTQQDVVHEVPSCPGPQSLCIEDG